MARDLLIGQVIYKYPISIDYDLEIFEEDFQYNEELQEYWVDIIKKLQGNENTPIIITSLGIQAPSGTVFQINSTEIVIGVSGIFELDNIIDINTLLMKKSINLDRVIIDMIYERKGGK